MNEKEHDPVSDLNEKLSDGNKLEGAECIENITSEDEVNENEYDPVSDLNEQLSDGNELEGAEDIKKNASWGQQHSVEDDVNSYNEDWYCPE